MPDSEPGASTCSVAELRRYTLHPGRRDTLVSLFDRHFVETQEAAGMQVLGQFTDLDRPDVFFWLRAFADMATRRHALEAFYGGPVWAAHRDAANATMIDSDDVHLLRPAWPGAGLPFRPDGRPAATGTSDGVGGGQGRVEVMVCPLQAPASPALKSVCRERLAPLFEARGAWAQGWYETEPAPNDFPRLPVRRDGPVLVAVSLWPAPSHPGGEPPGGWHGAGAGALLSAWLAVPVEHHRGTPTRRSALSAAPGDRD